MRTVRVFIFCLSIFAGICMGSSQLEAVVPYPVSLEPQPPVSAREGYLKGIIQKYGVQEQENIDFIHGLRSAFPAGDQRLTGIVERLRSQEQKNIEFINEIKVEITKDLKGGTDMKDKVYWMGVAVAVLTFGFLAVGFLRR